LFRDLFLATGLYGTILFWSSYICISYDKLAACQKELKGKISAIKANQNEFREAINDTLDRKLNSIITSAKSMGSNL
jgi:hypothetical protein